MKLNNRENFYIKNNFEYSKSKKVKYKKNINILNKNVNYLLNNIDNNKDALHSFSKKFRHQFNKKELHKFKKFKTITIIGMGGSILGIEAFSAFLRYKIKKELIFINNLEELNIQYLNQKKNIKNSLYIIISKSGNTIETIINLNLLKKHIKPYNAIVITENKKSLLRNFCKNFKIINIKHKNYIGGRYSVLSEVGMLPAYLMGLNIDKFKVDLLNFIKINKKKSLLIQSASKLSKIISSKKITSIILFNYCSELKYFLYWCQQLIAESLGKKGKGLLPVISEAPKDHHSLLQLYLDGPKDKLFYIFSSRTKNKNKIKNNLKEKEINFIKDKSINQILEAKKNAFIQILKAKKIPFREFKINKINEETIGELFSYFILETVLIGKCLNINPFDQPAVEQVKILTKKILTS